MQSGVCCCGPDTAHVISVCRSSHTLYLLSFISQKNTALLNPPTRSEQIHSQSCLFFAFMLSSHKRLLSGPSSIITWHTRVTSLCSLWSRSTSLNPIKQKSADQHISLSFHLALKTDTGCKINPKGFWEQGSQKPLGPHIALSTSGLCGATGPWCSLATPLPSSSLHHQVFVTVMLVLLFVWRACGHFVSLLHYRVDLTDSHLQTFSSVCMYSLSIFRSESRPHYCMKPFNSSIPCLRICPGVIDGAALCRCRFLNSIYERIWMISRPTCSLLMRTNCAQGIHDLIL